MKTIFLFLGLLVSGISFSQEYKDSIFSVRGFTCSCKYNFNTADDTGIYDRSGKPAAYPGAEIEWKKFVKKNIDKGFKGKHIVEVRFDVDKNGDLSNFLLQNKAPNQKYEEVVRVLKMSGKWFPSVQDGFCVKSSVWLSFEL